MDKLKVGLFNDSFPPTIDGVANVTYNYAKIIQRDYGEAVVATPFYPDVTDDYPFEVVRYPSAYLNKELGYRAGLPFDIKTVGELSKKEFDVIHSHCPCMSTILAREVRFNSGAPVILTYHTKFDIDIGNLTASDMLRRIAIKALVDNISTCDEVWTVSRGAGENLRSLGYEGEYVVMENGTDFARGRASESEIAELAAKYGTAGKTVFLFVGRMMWYKGLKLSLDGLAAAKAAGADFRFLLVGDGADRAEIKKYAETLGLEKECVFTGAIRSRELLRAYFSLADLFLFPSDFDTNGIVVREAAACGCPSLLLAGSCAAEGIDDGKTGIMITPDAEAMTAKLLFACQNREALRKIGEAACEKIYVSWDDAVAAAVERYHIVIDKFASRPRRERPKYDRPLRLELKEDRQTKKSVFYGKKKLLLLKP